MAGRGNLEASTEKEEEKGKKAIWKKGAKEEDERKKVPGQLEMGQAIPGQAIHPA